MQFGSDIAFFIKGGTALVQGVGELITASAPTPYTHFILINPNIHSDTGQVYRDFDNAGGYLMIMERRLNLVKMI